MHYSVGDILQYKRRAAVRICAASGPLDMGKKKGKRPVKRKQSDPTAAVLATSPGDIIRRGANLQVGEIRGISRTRKPPEGRDLGQRGLAKQFPGDIGRGKGVSRWTTVSAVSKVIWHW